MRGRSSPSLGRSAKHLLCFDGPARPLPTRPPRASSTPQSLSARPSQRACACAGYVSIVIKLSTCASVRRAAVVIGEKARRACAHRAGAPRSRVRSRGGRGTGSAGAVETQEVFRRSDPGWARASPAGPVPRPPREPAPPPQLRDRRDPSPSHDACEKYGLARPRDAQYSPGSRLTLAQQPEVFLADIAREQCATQVPSPACPGCRRPARRFPSEWRASA